MRNIHDWSARVLVFGLLAVAAGVGFYSMSEAKRADANQKEQAGLPGPVVNTHVLMERFHEGYYKALREGVKQEPASVAQWKVIEHNAVRIAEAANLVAIRNVKDEKRAAWMKLTAANQQAALALYEAARARKFDDAERAYARVIESCNACHKQMEPDEAPMLEP